MKRKWLLLLTLVMGMVMSMSFTALAAVWKTGAELNQSRWWYDNEDGTYARGGWQWIDGNQDGTAECYYFDGEGWMAAGGTTPDGYEVNADGAWIQNGVVQTKAVNQPVTGNSGTLIVYFSRTGTTRQAATQIHQLTGGDLVELEVTEPYNGSYQETLNRAERELSANARPALATSISNMEHYDTVFVGYPIWYGDAPMAIDTFLESYDFTGKTIVPFCTSGSSGIESSLRTIRSLCPSATVLQGIRIGSTSEIEPWLTQLGVLP